MFQEAWVISLDRRPERLQEFQDSYPSQLPRANRFSAIDGKKVPAPNWWTAGAGAWGCYKSHVSIIEDCLNRGVESVLIMEDDCQFEMDFDSVWQQYLNAIPSDWGMLYLGGQHLKTEEMKPYRVNDYWYTPYNVNRTHCYALKAPFMQRVYEYLHPAKWKRSFHIDHHYGGLHEKQEGQVYCSSKWLCAQRENESDIANKSFSYRRFDSASEIAGLDTEFVAVMGLHGGGTSVVSMILIELGVYMGDILEGYHGKCEPKHLAKMFETALPLGATKPATRKCRLRRQFASWVTQHCRRARRKGVIAGAKYPQLSAYGFLIEQVCGNCLKVIRVERELSECIASIKRRTGKAHRAHQELLHRKREAFLETQGSYHTIDYDALCSDPETQVRGLVSYLNLTVSEDQIKSAVSIVATKS